MQNINSIQIPMTKELEEFFKYRYKGETTKLIEDFLIYLNTQKKAYEINKSLQQVKSGQTKDIRKLLDEL